MKTLLVIVALMASLTIGPATAYAAPISTTYCEQSLRGQTGQAPDNDIKVAWDRIEYTYPGLNLVSSSATYFNRIQDQDLFVGWRFNASNGSVINEQFHCWRDENSVYHDGKI